MKKRGFTLIELLVVIAIIGLLSSVVLASLNSARAKARDAKRRVELTQLAKAIQLYYEANNQTYPPPMGVDKLVTTETGDWPANFKTALSPYLPNVPIDPVSNNPANYYAFYHPDPTWAPVQPGVFSPCSGKYVVWGFLEKGGSTNTCGYGGDIRFFIVID